MTKEELNRRRMMFQINAKRNELLKPEDIGTSTVRHSATNDFLAFRKKVAAGMKKQKEQNAEVFNVTAANLQNYQDMLDNNELIHAGTSDFKPTYYQKVENAFGPGKHRYFYTKEEWDAYQNELAGYRKKADEYVKNRDANNNAGANRAANESKEAVRQQNLKAGERGANLLANQKSREAAIKNSETTVSKEEFERRVAKDKEAQKNPVQKMGNSVKTAVKDLVKAEAIKSDTDRWNKYDKDIRNSIVKSDPTYSNIKTQSDFVKAAKEAGGVDKFYDDLEAKIKKAQGDRAAKEKVNNSNKSETTKEPEVSKEYKEEKEYNTTGKSSEKSSNTGDTAEERQKKILDDAFKEGANADDLASKYGVSTEYIQNMVYNASGKKVPTKKEMESKNSDNSGSNKTGTVSKEYQQELEANSKKNIYELKSGPKNGSSKSSSEPIEFTMENGKTVKKKSAKHDGLEDGIKTSDAMTPEQEYIAFRKKVEAGMKHFGLNRNLMSVPKNQALADGDSMSHAGTGNFKYYNKIKLPSGEVRYFYTKEEWDAYNNQVKENNNEDSKNLEWQRKHVLNNGDGRSFNQKELKQYESYNKSLKNKDSSNLTVKEGFISKGSKNIKNAAQDVSKDIANLNITSKSERNAINGLLHDKCTILEKKYESKFDDIKKNIPDQYPFKNEFVDLDDTLRSTVKDIESQVIKEYLNNKDGKALTESGTIIDSKFKDVESNLEKELSKREKSIESFNNMKKSLNKIKTIEDDTKNLSKFEEQVLADELGLPEWSEEAIAKKYGIDENSAKDPGDDYGASNFDKLAEAYDAFWNDYKAAKKAINSSASKAKEED